MAHARTFSFTDDAVNVAFPAASTNGSKTLAPGPMTGPQSADSSLLLFQLRRAQSFWYQELYKSDPTPLTDPWPFLWQMCHDMREWGDSLPASLPAGIRRMFDQELRYSYVYCLAPSARAPRISDYSRLLIFEHALDYLDSMYETAHGGLNSAFYTYQDALKVYFMANQFMAVLRDAEEMLLSGATPPAPPVSGPGLAPAPPIPRRHSADDNVERSLRCLERIPKTLELYGARWEDCAMLKQSLEDISREPLEGLRKRRQGSGRPQGQGLDAGLYQPNGVGVMPPPPGVAVMQGPAPTAAVDMPWAAVDPAQVMMQGGGQR